MEAEKVGLCITSELARATLARELSEAGYSVKLVREVEELVPYHPDAVVVEFRGSKDLLALEQVKKMLPEAGLTLFSRLPGSKMLRLLYEFEINSVVNIESTRISLIRSIEAAISGEEYFDEETLIFVLSDKYRSIYNRMASITSREKDIINGIMDDLTNDEIALKYKLSVRTVNAHKRNILQKIDVRSLVGLARMMTRFSFLYD